MPRTTRRSPRQARSRATVDAILEAAAQVLAEYGPVGATTNRIAERAGVSVGSVYQYFSNKKQLYTALGDRFINGLRATVQDLAPRLQGEAPAQALMHTMDALLARVTADPVLHGMLHVTALPPRDFEVINVFERELEQLVTALIEGHPTFRATTDDPELSAKVLVRACSGLMARTLALEPELVASPRFRDELIRLIDGYTGGALLSG